MVTTFTSFGITIYYSAIIIKNTPSEIHKMYGLNITNEDRTYNWYGWANLPIFFSGANNFYEGNFVTLTIYSEHAEPRNFFYLSAGALTLFTAVTCILGYINYFAFGNAADAIIFLNLPNK